MIIEEEDFFSSVDGEVEVIDDIDSHFYDIDFSDFDGRDFKKSLKRVNKAIDKRKKKKKVTDIPVYRKATMRGKTKQANTTKRVIVPDDREVIIEGVDKFILSKESKDDVIKNIGYYKGKKLKELILVLDNSASIIDFNLELFNPSMPLDYLYSTSGNLNNKITTAGVDVSYSDVLFNLLGNPAHIINAKFNFAGVNPTGQVAQTLIMKNKSINGYEKIEPINLNLQIDTMQVDGNLVFFAIADVLNRPFIPNGMDVIQYKVLAGNICTFCFYYEQKDLRKIFYKDTPKLNKLL
jgi:hypothetical protein